MFCPYIGEECLEARDCKKCFNHPNNDHADAENVPFTIEYLEDCTKSLINLNMELMNDIENFTNVGVDINQYTSMMVQLKLLQAILNSLPLVLV